jgi:hypothetical protein
MNPKRMQFNGDTVGASVISNTYPIDQNDGFTWYGILQLTARPTGSLVLCAIRTGNEFLSLIHNSSGDTLRVDAVFLSGESATNCRITSSDIGSLYGSPIYAAITYDNTSNTVKFWLNGVSQGVGNPSGTIVLTAFTEVVYQTGQALGSDWYLWGDCFWDRKLPDSAIQNHLAAGKDPLFKSLQGYVGNIVQYNAFGTPDVGTTGSGQTLTPLIGNAVTTGNSFVGLTADVCSGLSNPTTIRAVVGASWANDYQFWNFINYVLEDQNASENNNALTHLQSGSSLTMIQAAPSSAGVIEYDDGVLAKQDFEALIISPNHRDGVESYGTTIAQEIAAATLIVNTDTGKAFADNSYHAGKPVYVIDATLEEETTDAEWLTAYTAPIADTDDAMDQSRAALNAFVDALRVAVPNPVYRIPTNEVIRRVMARVSELSIAKVVNDPENELAGGADWDGIMRDSFVHYNEWGKFINGITACTVLLKRKIVVDMTDSAVYGPYTTTNDYDASVPDMTQADADIICAEAWLAAVAAGNLTGVSRGNRQQLLVP